MKTCKSGTTLRTVTVLASQSDYILSGGRTTPYISLKPHIMIAAQQELNKYLLSYKSIQVLGSPEYKSK